MRNPEFGPSRSLVSEAKRFTAVAVLFVGSLAITSSSSNGSETQLNPAHVQDKANIDNSYSRLKAIYKTLNQSIKYSTEVLHHPFNFIKDGDKSEYLSMNITGRGKTTVWLDVACHGKYNLEYFDWQREMSSNSVCRDTSTPSFEVLKPGHYTLYIDDFSHIAWAVGSSVEMQEVSNYTSGG